MSRLFAEIPGSNLLGAAFYFLILLAGLTSGIGLLEAVVATVMDLRGVPRKTAVILTLVLIALMCIIPLLSKGPWADARLLGKDGFQLADFISGNVLLPLGALMLAFYVPVVWKFGKFQRCVNRGASRFRISDGWGLLVKFGLPAALILIVLRGLALV
jgi:NSS family neurotransmitter:Na+ symporter